LPFQLIFSLPFYKLSKVILGFYDQRFVHLILFFGLLYLFYKLVFKENRIFIFILFFISPVFITYFIAGYNDIFVIFWLVLSFFLLAKNKYGWSAFFFGLACSSKQSAWLAIPFYFSYFYFLSQGNFYQKIKGIFEKTWPFFAAIFLIIIPFLIWDAGDFIEDIFLMPIGSLKLNYPISGVGFSSLLLKLRLVKNAWDNYPFWIFQLLFALPLLAILLKEQKNNNQVNFIVFFYALLLFIVWYFARYFNESHLAYILYLFIISLGFKKELFKKA